MALPSSQLKVKTLVRPDSWVVVAYCVVTLLGASPVSAIVLQLRWLVRNGMAKQLTLPQFR
jgi:hypothetical protein